MIWRKYQLDKTIFKITKTVTLWKTERGLIEINENTLALPIKHENQRKGFIFHGHGKLLLDAIIETKKGAVGKSIEKEINEPFLMLGNVEEIQQNLCTANNEDLTKMGYENPERFIAKAEALYGRFLVNIRLGSPCEEELIFAFQNKTSKLEILVAKGSKLVYRAKDIIFVSSKDKVILKSPGKVALLRNGKSVIIQK